MHDSDWSPRPYQLDAVERFKSLSLPRRLLLAWYMRSGKSRGSLLCARALNPERALIVVPALVRPHWAREIARIFPDRELGVIDTGRKRITGLSKAEAERRDRAYAAPFQLTSYDLLPQTDPGPWDVIILDEVHELRSPMSKQAKEVRKRLWRDNPEAAALGLSGTLIPNEVKDIWNILDTFWPGDWGAAARTGDISWKFKDKYCHRTLLDWGAGSAVKHYGFKEERRAELTALLQPLVHEVSEAEVAPYLPPLFVEPLYVDDPGADPLDTAVDWYEQNVRDAQHLGIYTHLKETARELQRRLPQAKLIDGDMDTNKRDEVLQAAQAESRSLIVGTTHSLQQGISLAFQKSALILEWQTAMDQVLQFIGRFAGPESQAKTPTYVQIYMTPDDESRADTLRSRVEDKNSLLKAGRVENLALEVFGRREYSDEQLGVMFSNMMGSFNPAKAEWQEEDE